ncbi:acetyltransferase (GNAT) family protein [Mariniflexile fucanivorans]|uniref:Acetyltransferase (GNAT) family protein n=1 Tax=Mariniflexile fucanivorans TaxID=264023 RepID=A0A4R1RGH9_9FLAO|nr:GNAT family N-acetyltransferase [Mariniflexile fucanivorans]TCL65029.1 acetyltransferase (GNAT) family protein [Mariniflexile fucanivorans]
MKYVKREQFIWNFQNRELIPSCYEKVFFNSANYKNENTSNSTEPVIYVSLVPTYLKYTLINDADYTQKKIIHKGKSGAGILIDGDYTVDSYLQKFTKRQLRVNLKRAITRLEESFNITYEYNFGTITKEKYNNLLFELRSMLEKRFQEKNIENMFLREWELHTKDLFNLINNKKASLFVIYHSEKPISISLNMHIKNSILFAKINAYDTDFAKFSLGHLDNYLLLGWCLDNKYHFLDLGFGILDYKMKWCNVFYDFEYHIYSKKGSLITKGISFFEVSKIKLKNHIKRLKIQEHLLNLKSFLKKPKKVIYQPKPKYKLKTVTAKESLNEKELKEINIKNEAYKSIRKPIYNYLYSNKLHIDTIKTYILITEDNCFVFKTKKNIIKINIL